VHYGGRNLWIGSKFASMGCFSPRQSEELIKERVAYSAREPPAPRWVEETFQSINFTCALAKINRPRGDKVRALESTFLRLINSLKGATWKALRWAALSALLRKLLKPTLKIILCVLSYISPCERVMHMRRDRRATKMYFSAKSDSKSWAKSAKKESTKVGDRLLTSYN